MFSLKQLIKALNRLQKVSSLSTFENLYDLIKQTPTTSTATAVLSVISPTNTLQPPATSAHVGQHVADTSLIRSRTVDATKTAHDSISLLSDEREHGTNKTNTRHFYTINSQCLHTKQKQTQFAMSSLAAEPLSATATPSNSPPANGDNSVVTNGCCKPAEQDANGSAGAASATAAATPSVKTCFNTGLSDILKFMELIGNLKHTKRTGWVLRDVNDCESISGHMYRMSMMTFLLDGSEGLNQIRCMELALVHDLAESLVGDITPFCGVSKGDKRAMEFKAMDDICKLIEPRGKRIMELFQEYEHGESAESKFVKDLDRLDMVMQAFEYEKRDDCLLKHQEFFDSTRGKFKHPFVKQLVEEIYEQRDKLARDKGAKPPPPVHVPDMEENGTTEDHKNKTSS